MAVKRVAQARTVVVAVRLTPAEAEQLDGLRGALTRSEWLRWVLLREGRKGSGGGDRGGD